MQVLKECSLLMFRQDPHSKMALQEFFSGESAEPNLKSVMTNICQWFLQEWLSSPNLEYLSHTSTDTLLFSLVFALSKTTEEWEKH